MAQTYEQLVSGTTTFGVLYGKINNLVEALRSAFSGTSFPTSPSPVEGQFCYRTDIDKLYVYVDSSWKEVATENTGLGAEIINARGTKSTLDQRFDVALNEDGTLKASTTLNPSQWYKPSLTFTYISSTSFKVNGDQTDIYASTRRLKLNLVASTVYSEVISATYSAGPNETTIVILDAVLDATLVDIEHSLFLPRKNNGALSSAMLGGILRSTYEAAGANTYTVTIAEITAYNTGDVYIIKFLNGNTTTNPTLNINSLGAKTIIKTDGEFLMAGNMPAGHVSVLRYDGTNMILLNPAINTGNCEIHHAKFNFSSDLIFTPNSTYSYHQMDLDVAAGILFNSTTSKPRKFENINLTIDITVSGANGLDAGSEENNVWYHFWVIGKEDGTIAGLASLSSTAPTLPSGYTYKAYAGANFNNPNGDLIPIRQTGNNVVRGHIQILENGGSIAFAYLDISAAAPPTAQMLSGYGEVSYYSAGGALKIASSELGRGITKIGDCNATTISRGYWRALQYEGVLYYCVSQAGVLGNIWVTGWEY